MDKGKIKRYLIRVYEKSLDEDIISNAAQVAFYFLFALFPLLIFLVSIFGIVLGQSNEIRQELFSYLKQVMPASAYDLVFKTMDEVVQGSSGGKITFGLLATLYSASAGIDSLRTALNDIYNLTEERSWWKRKLMSVAITLGLGVLIFVALGIIFYGSQFVNFILGGIGLPISSPLFLHAVSFIIVLAVLLITFDVLYYFVPDHKNLKWKWVTPGAIVAILLWLAVSKGFSIYLEYFDSYAKTYGSLGAMIVLILWLYLTALVILAGGVFNSILDQFANGQYERLSPEEKENLKNDSADEDNKAKTAKEREKSIDADDAGSEAKSAPKVGEVVKAEKTKFKVVVGAVLASVIELISFKNKR